MYSRRRTEFFQHEITRPSQMPTTAPLAPPDAQERCHTACQEAPVVISPMLLAPIAITEASCFLRDPMYVAQEKYDGERLLLDVRLASIHGYSRRGVTVPLQAAWEPP